MKAAAFAVIRSTASAIALLGVRSSTPLFLLAAMLAGPNFARASVVTEIITKDTQHRAEIGFELTATPGDGSTDFELLLPPDREATKQFFAAQLVIGEIVSAPLDLADHEGGPKGTRIIWNVAIADDLLDRATIRLRRRPDGPRSDREYGYDVRLDTYVDPNRQRATAAVDADNAAQAQSESTGTLGGDSAARRAGAEITQYWERWKKTRGKGNAYRYVIQYSCECADAEYGPVIVEVEADKAVSARFARSGEELPKRRRDLFLRTIDDVFQRLQKEAADADELAVVYHPKWGYPMSVSVDRNADAEDDEYERELLLLSPWITVPGITPELPARHLRETDAPDDQLGASDSRGAANGTSIVPAKQIDYTPQLSTAAYWDTHQIAVVRVVTSDTDGIGKRQVTLQTLQPFSEGRTQESRKVLISHFFWLDSGDDARPVIAEQDVLAVFFAKSGVGQVAATTLSAEFESSPLVQTLAKIAELRAKGSLDAFSEGVFSDDATVALYCLNSMLHRIPADADAYSRRLVALRNNETTSAEIRLLASRLRSRVRGLSENSADEYEWIQGAFVSSKLDDWTRLRPFTERLLEFPSRRAETVDFLVTMALDRRARQAMRIAAYSTFEDPELFHFQHPDRQSDRIVEACAALLQDPDPMLRMAGSQLMHNLAQDVRQRSRDPDAAHSIGMRIRKSLSDALESESDEVCRARMQQHYESLAGN